MIGHFERKSKEGVGSDDIYNNEERVKQCDKVSAPTIHNSGVSAVTLSRVLEVCFEELNVEGNVE